eukprot:TRINITY_DN5422_c0_g1_i1.p1 TRINITY_DN5422_c0_g1~~TRINITY_DN5422_c0_g1_i1.p1  ORF type:complete len:271 (+),score=40.84 TRINITY_DN5422_c0_g1_i1:113-925(+)
MTSDSGKLRKVEAIPSLARPAPFFRTLTAGPTPQSSGGGQNSIADFKSSRDANASPSSNSPSPSFKRAPFRRSKTKPDILAQDASVRLFTAGSASILERETVEQIETSVSPRHRAVQFVQDQAAVLEPRASVRFTGKAGINANTDISDVLELDYGSEIPTPASSPDVSPPSSGLQTPDLAHISSNLTGGLSAAALAEAATRLSNPSTPGRLSRSSSYSSVGTHNRKTYPAVERLSRAGSLNTIDMGFLGSSSRSSSSVSMNRSNSSLSIV